MDVLDRLNQESEQRIHSAEGMPESIKAMVYLHVAKPWIPGFKSIVISPLREGLEKFFEEEVFGWEGHVWHYPSLEWWLSHARTSHPPEGAGCDTGAHVDFLTSEGKDAEFLYANILQDGSAYILGPEDFEAECRWWEGVFPKIAARGGSARYADYRDYGGY